MGFALAALYLVCHGMALTVSGQASLPSFLFLTAAPLMACIACLWRVRRDGLMSGWLAPVIAMLLWAGGMAATMYQEIGRGNVDALSAFSMLLYVLYGVPIVLALARARQERWYANLIDASLAALLGALFSVQTFWYAHLDAIDGTGLAGLRLMFDAENAFIAAFALLRFLGAEHPSRREFFGAMSLFTGVYFIVASLINHFTSDIAFGAYVDLLIDVPFLVLILVALRPATTAAPRVSRRLVRVIRAGRPLILPLCLLVVSALVLEHHPELAVVGFIAATVGVGARSTLQQVGLLERQEALDVMARQDALTGVANRRRFDQVLSEEWQRAQRGNHVLALLLIDVDRFKQFNDRHGHPLGDRCLQSVASLLSACAERSTDLVARYGGEEFAVVVPLTPRDGVLALAERMRAAVAASSSSSQLPPVTISIGVAFASDVAGDQPDALVAAADAALYAAKHGGRDRVALHAPASALSAAHSRP